ncbi:MAG TPA: DUF3857 domain-containing protein [Kofleriaceae bacterium]
MWARLVGLVAVASAMVASAPSKAEAREAAAWKIAPAPGWVAPAPAEATKRAPGDASVVEYLLDDTQVRVSPTSTERFHHLTRRARTIRHVEDGSQLELEFNPAHERLVIHHAQVLRGGRAVFTLTARDVRIVQRERDLEQRIYDGTLTAVVFLRDVRVDDVIDYSFTVAGSDPLLEGKYVTRFWLAGDTFTDAWRQRILLPAGRSLTVKAHGLDLPPKVTTTGDWREYLWERRDVAPVESDDKLPPWFEGRPWVDASEFGSWAEVAGLFARLFPPRQPADAAMAAELAKLRARGATDEERLLEATRFVQDEIRYLGLEIGLGGHKPFAPSVVFERRFGDCKDKAVLLVALLGELGFQARPALVNTSWGRGLDEALPSPFAFDHAIVEVTVDGTSRFIDPTVSYQRGPLAGRQPPEFERALLVAQDTRSLVSIPRPSLAQPSVAVRETFVVAADGASTNLEVETTLRYDEADRMRERLARRGRKEIGREYLNYYAEDDASVSLNGELEAVDDEGHDLLVLREHYVYANFWRDDKREFRVTALEGHIKDPRIRLRKMPFALEFPLNVAHTTIVRMSTPSDAEPESQALGDDHLRFNFTARPEGGDLVIRYELQTLADAVPPGKAQRFFAVLDEIRGRTGYVLRKPTGQGGGASPGWKSRDGLLGLIVFCGVVLGLLVVGGRELVRRVRKRAFRKQTQFTSGEAAATAIELASEAEASARVAALRCTCGARYRPEPEADPQRVAYDGRTLLVLTARCADCGNRRPVFLAMRPDPRSTAN